jgi:hypothetical protein
MNDYTIPKDLRALPLERKSGHEVFHENGVSVGVNLLGFWQWSSSDLLGNTDRGRLAEYIVATAVGVAGGVRSGWEAYDLETPSRIRVEVRASAYVQTWGQKSLSKIVFGIRPTRAWNPEANTFAAECRRQSDIYVFAVLAEREKARVNPLDLAQWEFYVLPAKTLDEGAPIQKSIGLSSVLRLGAVKVSYQELADAIERSVEGKGDGGRRMVPAIVPAAGSPAKIAGKDIWFMLCSERCGDELTAAVQREMNPFCEIAKP